MYTPIRKKIVSDENIKPVSVIVDWADWLEIERMLEHGLASGLPTGTMLGTPAGDLEKFRGCRDGQ